MLSSWGEQYTATERNNIFYKNKWKMAFLEKIAGPPIRKPDFQRVIFLINHADFLFCYLISTVLCEKD